MTDPPPLQRAASTTGEPVWLVSGYGAVRDLLGEARLSRSHPDPRHPARMTQIAVFGGPIGDPDEERADHARMRRLLTRSFGARRIEALRPRVQALVDRLLDGMAAAGPPGDLHAAVATRLPGLTICELLGVPDGDRAAFLGWAAEAPQMQHPARSRAALQSLWRYLGALVQAKKAAPGEDLVSDLLAQEGSGGDPLLTDDGVAHLAAGMLFAGTATVTSVIDRGCVLLLTRPDQRNALIADPSLAAGAVEEIARHPGEVAPPATAGARRGGLPKYAGADIAYGGQTIHRGDTVLFDVTGANTDPSQFEDPLRFDIARAVNPHLAFSWGAHFCIGAPLARMELQCLFATLFRRFPTLALAVPVRQLRPVPGRVEGVVEALPVRW